MTAITAVLFDMVGVLLRHRIDIAKSEFLDAIENVICSEMDQGFAKNRAMTELHIDEVQFASAVRKIPEKYEKDERLWRLLADLKGKRHTAILNNGSSLTLDYFDEFFGIYSTVDLFMNSASEGVAKPTPKFFLRACERLHVSPNDCLFIDDAKAHVIAAKKLGMQTIHWSGTKADYQTLSETLTLIV